MTSGEFRHTSRTAAALSPSLVQAKKSQVKGEKTNAHHRFSQVNNGACADKIFWEPNYRPGRTRVYLSTCDGGFSAAEWNQEGANQSAEARLYFADATGDGLADIILWEPADGRTYVYAPVGDGSFSHSSTHWEGYDAQYETHYYYADVNDDRIVWRPNEQEGRPQIYYGSAAGFADAPTLVNMGFSQSSATDFFYANVDGINGADQIYWNAGFEGGNTRAYLARDRWQTGRKRKPRKSQPVVPSEKPRKPQLTLPEEKPDSSRRPSKPRNPWSSSRPRGWKSRWSAHRHGEATISVPDEIGI